MLNKKVILIGLAFIFMAIIFVSASTLTDNSQASFNLGTYNWTFYNSSGFVQLNSSRLNGTFTSQIFNAGNPHWNNISWIQGGYYQQELPNNQGIETGLGGVNMTGNVLLMHMNEASGTIVDYSGTGNNGTQIGGVTYSAVGKLNNALMFDGVNDYINISDSNSLDLTNQFAISLWFKPAILTQTNRYLLSKQNSAGGDNVYSINWEYHNNKITFYANGHTGDGSGFYPNTISEMDISDTNWHHIVYSYNGSQWEGYIDGRNNFSVGKIFTLATSTKNLLIATFDGIGYFSNGTLDEFAIWNRSLSAVEILDIYKRGALRLNLSVQSCDDAACSGESWTNLGSNLTSPQNLNVANNTYFQYKLDFLTDNVSYTPELYNVTVDYTALNLAPTEILNSPVNNSYIDAVSSVLLNATIYDLNLNNMTVWFYGNGNLLNTAYNQTNGTSVTYNWTGLSLGLHNWTVIANDGLLNSTNEIFFFNLINLAVNCEAGGGYQQEAIVPVYGNISDGINPLSSQAVNISIYKNNNLNTSKLLTSLSDGSFSSSFSGLSVGSYTLYANMTYQGHNKSCTDIFVVGSPASFILDKITTIYNITNTTINYNITLRLTNKGGSDATSSNITDSDSSDSPYNLGTVSANSSVVRSYLMNLTRQDTISYQLLSIATAWGIDSYSNSLISTNSTEINVTIPDTVIGKQVAITKNVVYSSENTTSTTYNVSSTLYNSGDEDLTSINYIDSDLNDSAFTINLNKGESYLISKLVMIDKAASNTNHQFALGTATISGLNFYSNRPTIRIPGYGGPADTYVYAPESVSASASFDSVIRIKNLNSDAGQNFIIDYWITNEAETINYSSGQSTVYAAASGETNTSVTLTSPSSAGTYRLRALTSYTGGLDTAYDSFMVTVTSTPATGSTSGGTGGGITGEAVSEIVCNLPYIRYGKECCLDYNNNKICDRDEETPVIIQNESGGASEEIKENPSGKNKIFESVNELFLSIGEEFSYLTNVFRNFIANNNVYSVYGVGALVLILIIAMIIWLILKFTRKPRDTTRLKNLIGIQVYAENGIYIGKIKEVYLWDKMPKIAGWLIKVNGKIRKKIRKKNIMLESKHVKSIKHVMIIDEKVAEHLEDYKE